MSGNVAPKIILDGLILHLDAANVRSYPGTGTLWTDLSKQQQVDGTLTNGPTFDSSNMGSIVFDGVDDYVGYPGTTDLLTTSSITIDIFLRLDGTQLSYADIFDYNHSFPSFGGFVLQNDGSGNETFYFACWNGSSFDFIYFDVPLTNTYFHLVAVKDGANYTIYIDSNPLFTGTGSNFLEATGRNMRIGANADVYGRYIKGAIANFKIYNRALTPAEVSQNYNAIKTRFGL